MSSRRWALPLALLLGMLTLTAACGSNKKQSERTGGKDAAVSHYRMGQQYLTQRRPDLAATEFEQAVQLDGDNSLYHNVLGIAYLSVDRFEEAVECFQRVLAINPYFTDAHNSLGIVYAEMGKVDRAVEEFERVLEDGTYPTPEVARYNIGKVLREAGEAEAALPYLRKAVLSQPSSSGWRLELARALEDLERWYEIPTVLKPVLDQDPANVEAMLRLGASYLQLGERSRGRELLQRVVSLAPGSALEARAQQLLKPGL